MIKLRLLVCCLICICCSYGQENKAALNQAFVIFEKDSQLKYAVSSITITDAESGTILYEKNMHYGLAPASSMKILTAAAAFELLGDKFRYKTLFYLNKDAGKPLSIFVEGSGDPTLGSSRFATAQTTTIIDSLSKKLLIHKITSFTGHWYASKKSSYSMIPRDWIWEDIGNYYGASWSMLNWNENQYTIWLLPGKQKGDPVKVISTAPAVDFTITNELRTGTAQSGDNAYVFFNPAEKGVTIKGTIPCCRDRFAIYGAVPDPDKYALQEFSSALGGTVSSAAFSETPVTGRQELLYTHQSPTLDSIIYWFMQKSINLYGEAMLHKIAASGADAEDEKVEVLRKFWQQKGIDIKSLTIVDGSGLSPANRVTTGAMAEVLSYAARQKWFPAFYKAFPDINGMKIKSGTIGGVRAYAGYIKGKSGKQYCFSFIVNNYNGSVSALSAKMLTVLNTLKK